MKTPLNAHKFLAFYTSTTGGPLRLPHDSIEHEAHRLLFLEASIAAEFVLKISRTSRRAVHGGDGQVCNPRIANVEKVATGIAARFSEIVSIFWFSPQFASWKIISTNAMDKGTTTYT